MSGFTQIWVWSLVVTARMCTIISVTVHARWKVPSHPKRPEERKQERLTSGPGSSWSEEWLPGTSGLHPSLPQGPFWADGRLWSSAAHRYIHTVTLGTFKEESIVNWNWEDRLRWWYVWYNRNKLYISSLEIKRFFSHNILTILTFNFFQFELPKLKNTSRD